MAFGDPLNIAPAQMQAPAPTTLDSLPPMAAAVQKPKINWLGVLADALAGAAGRPGPYASMMMQQRQDDRADERYQRRQSAELEQQKNLYLWKLAHPDTPAPTEYERALTAAGILPGSEAYIQHMKNFVQMKENPVFTYTDPATGALVLGSKGVPQPQILNELPPGARPVGGAGSPAPRTFP